MIDDAEGQSALGLLFQILLQEIARDRLQFDGCEVGDEMFADAIATGAGSGQLPFAPDEGKKRIANPIPDDPDAGDRFTGTIIDDRSTRAISESASGRVMVEHGPTIRLLRWRSSHQKAIQFQHPPDFLFWRLPR